MPIYKIFFFSYGMFDLPKRRTEAARGNPTILYGRRGRIHGLLRLFLRLRGLFLRKHADDLAGDRVHRRLPVLHRGLHFGRLLVAQLKVRGHSVWPTYLRRRRVRRHRRRPRGRGQGVGVAAVAAAAENGAGAARRTQHPVKKKEFQYSSSVVFKLHQRRRPIKVKKDFLRPK